MTRTRHRWFLPLVLALCSALCAAQGTQDAADPERTLLEASDALAAIDGLSAKLTLEGDGSDLVKSTMPTLSGRLTLGTHPEHGRTARAVGEIKEANDDEPRAYDVAVSRRRLAWSSASSRTFTIDDPDDPGRGVPNVVNYIELRPLVARRPLSTLIEDSAGLESLGREAVEGEACDVVLVTLSDEQIASRSFDMFKKERWFIGVDDRLPRRVERFNDEGILRATLRITFSPLEVTEIDADGLEPIRTDAYTVDDRLSEPEPEPSGASPAEPERPDVGANPGAQADPGAQPGSGAQADPAAPANPDAPAFDMTDAIGNTISRETQRGRVTLLAFGGSWCIPCRDLVPELTEIARSRADDPVDVVYAAVRERDPEAAAERHAGAGFAFVPETPASVTGAFKVRIYPTVVVIGPEGTILYEGHTGRDTTPAQLAQRARETIAGALAEAP